MGKKQKGKRTDLSGSQGGFDSPFAGLAGLKDALPEGEVSADPAPSAAPAERRSKVVIRREKSGRGGKTVTVVEGIGDERDQLAREMKKALGCGASVEGENVVLQGAQVDRAAKWLEAKGFPKVIRGN